MYLIKRNNGIYYIEYSTGEDQKKKRISTGKRNGIKFLKMEGNYAAFEVVPGNYHFINKHIK